MEALVQGFGLPSWNLVFADTKGKIGYRATGRVPRRTQVPYGTPEIALSDLEIKEWMSPHEVPHVLNPKRGFVVTANNRHFPEDSKLWTSRSNSMGFRGFRIEELLLATGKHDLASQKQIQCDTQASDARFILPELLKRLGDAPFEPQILEAVEELKKWDYNTGLQCKSCGLFRMWFELLGEHLRMNEHAFWNLLLDGELDGTRKSEFTKLFREKLTEAHALVSHAKNWGELHQSFFATFLGDRDVQSSLPTHGDTHSVSPGTSTWSRKLKKFVHTAGASQRILIEMSNPPRVHRMLPGANKSMKDPDFSPGSMWTRWRDCEYEQISWSTDWSSAQRVTLAR
jgi:penicillin amidase